MSPHLPGRSWEGQEPFLSFGQMVRGFLWLLVDDKDEREKNLYHPVAWPTAPPPRGSHSSPGGIAVCACSARPSRWSWVQQRFGNISPRPVLWQGPSEGLGGQEGTERSRDAADPSAKNSML